MNAHELFRAGKLGEAIEAMNAEVRSHPADPDRRGFLADLLCIAGNFDRADVQLDAITKILPGSVASMALVRQLVRAEQWRQQCFLEGRVPEFLEVPDARLQMHLRALVLLREGDQVGAAELLAAAEAERVAPRGTCGGQPFGEFRDCDDVTSSVFEVLTSTGKYYWIPFERVERIEFRGIERPRDLIWRRAGMTVRGGPDGEVYLPAVYAPAPADEVARLGRSTEWSEDEPVRGVGLRLFLVDDEPVPMTDLREIVFEAAAE
jgi:type VI secretion system protein ImpE